MLTFRELLFSALVMSVITSCTSPTNSSVVSSSNGIIDINITKALKESKDFALSEIIKDVEFVTLESTVESYFTFSTRIQVTENYIMVVGDMENRLLLFDRTGKFIRQLGRIGQGPGEYINPRHATMDPNEQFIIIKDMGYKLIKIDLQGRYIKQRNIQSECKSSIDAPPFFLDEAHFAFVFNRPRAPIDGYHRVSVYDSELILVEEMLPVANNDSLCLRRIDVPFMSSFQSSSYFFEGFTDTIFSINVGSNPKAKYHFSIQDNPYTLEHQTAGNSPNTNRDFTRVFRVLELSDYLLITVLTDENFVMLYDKEKKEAYLPIEGIKCDTSTRRPSTSHYIQNDLFGYNKLGLTNYQPDQNIIVSQIHLERISDRIDLECLTRKKVKYPRKRDQLTDMIERSTGEELPLIVIMTVK